MGGVGNHSTSLPTEQTPQLVETSHPPQFEIHHRENHCTTELKQ